METFDTLESVKRYYGKVLKSSKDLQTSACCSAESVPRHVASILKEIHPEVKDRFYGCGCPLPFELTGLTVLDLGSGSGRDCFILSKLVGETGTALGIDMTDEQLTVAREHTEYHRKQYGYPKTNVRFVRGYIEDLEAAGITTESVDVVVSNCVINLSPAKDRVFREIFRVLKPGGELYFSDVYADRRIPDEVRMDPILLGECLGGALYIEDYRRKMMAAGFIDPRVVSKRSLTVEKEALRAKVGTVQFYSITSRAFKIQTLEDRCEDYGQSAYYLGTLAESPSQFVLDDHHVFPAGSVVRVCHNTALMLTKTRLGPHFKIIGDSCTHFGPFDCGPHTTTTSNEGCC